MSDVQLQIYLVKKANALFISYWKRQQAQMRLQIELQKRPVLCHIFFILTTFDLLWHPDFFLLSHTINHLIRVNTKEDGRLVLAGNTCNWIFVTPILAWPPISEFQNQNQRVCFLNPWYLAKVQSFAWPKDNMIGVLRWNNSYHIFCKFSNELQLKVTFTW